jgi:hypothetical protein
MADNPVGEICERVAEVQALLDDHIAGGKHTAADVVAKAQAVLSETELLWANRPHRFLPGLTVVLFAERHERRTISRVSSGGDRRQSCSRAMEQGWVVSTE